MNSKFKLHSVLAVTPLLNSPFDTSVIIRPPVWLEYNRVEQNRVEWNKVEQQEDSSSFGSDARRSF